MNFKTSLLRCTTLALAAILVNPLGLLFSENSQALPLLFVGQNSRKGLADGKKLTTKTFQILGGFTKVRGIKPFPATFAGGIRGVVGDVSGDGQPDIIIGAGPGDVGPAIKFYGTSASNPPANLPSDFFAFDESYTGGVFLALGDVDGDLTNELIVGAGQDSSEVKVFNPQTGSVITSIVAMDPLFAGGVRVAAGDVNGDGKADVVVGAGPGAAPQVQVFSGETGAPISGGINDFLAYDESFTGGVSVATGYVNNDIYADIITAPEKGAGEVKVFSGLDGTLLNHFYAYNEGYRGGIRVSGGDVNSDGFFDIFTAPLKGKQPIKRWNGASGLAVDTLVPFGTSYRGGYNLYVF